MRGFNAIAMAGALFVAAHASAEEAQLLSIPLPIHDVFELRVGVAESFPPQYEVYARGTANSEDWIILPLQMRTPLSAVGVTGIVEFDFHGVPPFGGDVDGATPVAVESSAKFKTNLEIKAICVHAASNSLCYRFPEIVMLDNGHGPLPQRGGANASVDSPSDAAAAAGGETVVACGPTKDWNAWNDLMPPKPDFFHITGEVQVPNAGVTAYLVPRIPPGFNPTILLMDLCLVQKPGDWPPQPSWQTVRYDERLENINYRKVQIFCCGGNDPFVNLEVEDIH